MVFGVCFAGVAALNAPLLGMPPVWDAVGVFAPAVFLYESGFDLAGLLALPGYVDGGPNIHSLSLVTFSTWAAIWLSGGQPPVFLPGLHVLNFALAGLAGAVTFQVSRPLLGGSAAALGTTALLLFPPFLVQSGALHTEMAGAALVVLSLAALVARRPAWAIACALAACGVKSLGLVLLPPLTLLLAADARTAPTRRIARCAALWLPAIGIEAGKWAAAPPASGLARGLGEHLDLMLSHLCGVPDVLLLLVLSLLACLGLLVSAARTGLEGTLDDEPRRLLLATSLVPASCVVFVALVPLTGADFIPLQRYYVWVLAPALISVAGAFQALAGRRGVTLALAGLAVYAGLNRDGRFYPRAGETIRQFSVAERSYEYLDYYRVQHEGVRGVASIAEDRPAFVTRGELYYLASPLMGWVDRHVHNVHFVLEPPYDSGHLDHYPSDFYVLESDSNRYHGQGVVLDLVAQADRRSDYEPRLAAEWKSGPYTAKLIHIRSTLRSAQDESGKRAHR